MNEQTIEPEFEKKISGIEISQRIRGLFPGKPVLAGDQRRMDDNIDKNQIVACILDIGEMLLSNGADVNRVEDSIMRMSTAFDFSDCQVHAINSSIIVTMTSLDGSFITQARRIAGINTDLNKVSELNNLSRRICSGTPDMDFILSEMERIRNTSVYSPPMFYLGYIIAAAFFTLFFGGSWQDVLCSVPIALGIRFIKERLHQFNDNKMVDNVILSAFLTLAALIAQKFFPVLNTDTIIIGEIMLLIPGLAFCNSIHDMVMGDTISGVLSMFEALLRGLAIVIGYAAVWAVIGRLM